MQHYVSENGIGVNRSVLKKLKPHFFGITFTCHFISSLQLIGLIQSIKSYLRKNEKSYINYFNSFYYYKIITKIKIGKSKKNLNIFSDDKIQFI